MADDPNEVDGQEVTPPAGPLLSQADIDSEKNRSSVHKTGQLADTDGDGVPDYRDEAPAEYGADADGDNDDDADGDGIDDDDENDFDWTADFDNDASGFYSGDNDYCRMDSYGSRFNQYYNNAAPADQTAFDAAKQAQQTAAQAPLTADNFVALKQADTKLNIAAATIVVNAGGPDAPAAAERIRGLKGADTNLQKLETSLQGKTPAEKAAILQKDFPRQWERYQEGKPEHTGPRNGASYSAAQNDLPGGATEQPFNQRLYQLFASAVTPPAVVAPAPALAPATPTVQAPAYNG